MDGALLGGLLAIALSAVALLATFGFGPAPTEDVRVIRILGRAYIAGIAILGATVVVLAAVLESGVPGLVGAVLGLVTGLGAVGVFVALRGASPGPGGRTRTILRMAVAEAVAVLGCVGLLLAVFLTEPV